MSQKLKITDERREALLRSLQSHYFDQHAEEIGELKGELLIDFFLERLGPPVYNQAIGDARKFLQERIDELGDEIIDFDGEAFEG